MSFDHGVLVVPVSGFDINYPVGTTTFEAKLRSPERGFKRIYDTQLLVHRTTGQQLRTFRDPDWYMTLAQEVSFRALSKEQIDDLRALYEAAAGDVVQIRDCENRVWNAFLSEPVVTTSQYGKGCQYEVTFKFLAVFSQAPFSLDGGYAIGGGVGAPPNNTTPVLGLGEGDFVSPSSKRILAPTGHFLVTAGGDQIVYA